MRWAGGWSLAADVSGGGTSVVLWREGGWIVLRLSRLLLNEDYGINRAQEHMGNSYVAHEQAVKFASLAQKKMELDNHVMPRQQTSSSSQANR